MHTHAHINIYKHSLIILDVRTGCLNRIAHPFNILVNFCFNAQQNSYRNAIENLCRNLCKKFIQKFKKEINVEIYIEFYIENLYRILNWKFM